MGKHTIEESTPTPSVKRSRRPALIGVLSFAILGAVVATTLTLTQPSEKLTAVPTPPAIPVVTESPKPSVIPMPEIVVHHTVDTIADNSIVISGLDVTPGLWVTAGGAPYNSKTNPGGCRWSRNKGASWEVSGSPTMQIVVSLRAGATFETHGCLPWGIYRAY